MLCGPAAPSPERSSAAAAPPECVTSGARVAHEQHRERGHGGRHRAFGMRGADAVDRTTTARAARWSARRRPWGRRRARCGGAAAARRGDSRETHILDDALVHEADEAVQRLLLREPVGFGEDAEKTGVRRAVAVAGRAGEEVEDARARLVLVQELDDRRENVMGHVLMGDVAEEVEERLGELGAGLRGGEEGGKAMSARRGGGGGSRSSVARVP